MVVSFGKIERELIKIKKRCQIEISERVKGYQYYKKKGMVLRVLSLPISSR